MIYFISGLGADERVFQFMDLSAIEHQFIKWIKPHDQESLSDYCSRLIPQIILEKEIILIGVSFGGMVAQELAKLISCEKIIIISSIKTDQEFSWQMILARKTQIHRIVPTWFLIWSNLLTADFYFGTQSKTESKLLQQIIKDTDRHFLRWAIHQLMNWKNKSYPENLVHLHGTKDRIFPIRYVKKSIQIPNGGHFMIVNKIRELEPIIFELLTKSNISRV